MTLWKAASATGLGPRAQPAAQVFLNFLNAGIRILATKVLPHDRRSSLEELESSSEPLPGFVVARIHDPFYITTTPHFVQHTRAEP